MTLPEIQTDLSPQALYSQSPLGDRLADHPGETARWLGLALAQVWYGFEQQLARVPIVQAMENGTITLEQYRDILLNQRQQVVEGSRWITRAASSMDANYAIVRNALIAHAAQEHKDYLMLEQNFASVGGDPQVMQSQPKNIGAEALSAYIFQICSEPNPMHMFGATFIVEGLGAVKAGHWAQQLMTTLELSPEQVSFLAYHGANDEDHYENLIKVLGSPFIDEAVAVKLVKVAKTVGRLYALQLEEINNI